MFSKDGNLLYFSHIPRTGGRYIRSVLQKNSFVFDREYRKLYKNKVYIDLQESLHLNYEAAKFFDHRVVYATKFAVIRNPVTKFASAVSSEESIRMYFGGMENFLKLEDYGFFKYMLEEKEYKVRAGLVDNRKIAVKGLLYSPNNWFAYQKSFFNDKFLIWKYENGMGKELAKFLEAGIGTPISINNDITYQRADYDTKIPNFSLPDKIKKNVMNYYEEDYEFWDSYQI